MAGANRALAFLGATVAATLAVPVTVLLHEAGHYGAAVALGFREPRLRAFATEYGQGDYSDTHRLYVVAAGFIVTALLTAGAGALAMRWPRLPVLAVCLAAPIRALVWIPILVLVAQGRATIAGGDEVKIARLMHVPFGAVVGYGFAMVLFALLATVVGLRKRPAPERAPILLGLFIGLACGWIAYSVGAPRVLP